MAMKLDLGKTDVKINLSFAAAVTLMLITDESGICALALFCCFIHETGHIICLKLLGEAPSKIVLSFYGIKIERLPSVFHGRKKEMLIYFSGPLANFITALIFILVSAANAKLKIWAEISLAVGIFNIIPCRPLDGGNILFSALCGMAETEKAEKISLIISICVITPMLFCGALLALGNGNFTLIATSLYLLFAGIFDKNENESVKL